MPRNLDRRVESLVTVTAAPLRARLAEILEVNLADDVLAWDLDGDGSWHKVPTIVGVDAQQRLRELAEERAHPRG
jgi:polyphosphate kinase